RNWMTDTNGQLTAVIDFEHARWDVRAADLNRWWDTDFVEKPRLAGAFFDGYRGGNPDKTLWAQIQALRLLGAAGGVVWATRVGDAPFARTNREALHRLMRENIPAR
ncbi:MAG: phosphotransferase, partial [Akkermansiaceae bacterium]|nr:phosphotransferase [Armatimonadota bacterium]